MRHSANFTFIPPKNSLLELATEPEVEKPVHGVITDFKRLTGSADEAQYQLVIEPFFALLRHQIRSHRFFLNQSVPDVVDQILREHNFKGWEFEFNLKNTYPKREQINQTNNRRRPHLLPSSKWNNIQCQHQSLNAKAICIQPATKVIPVIFLPGVMGTNLMSTGKDKNQIWRGHGLVSTYFEWAAKKGKKRRELLNPHTIIVDNRGKINQNIYSDVREFISKLDKKGYHPTTYAFAVIKLAQMEP